MDFVKAVFYHLPAAAASSVALVVYALGTLGIAVLLYRWYRLRNEMDLDGSQTETSSEENDLVNGTLPTLIVRPSPALTGGLGWGMLAAKLVSVCLVVIALVLAIAINRAATARAQADFIVTCLEGKTSMAGPFSIYLKRVDIMERPLVALEISSPSEAPREVSLAQGESVHLTGDYQIQIKQIGLGIATFRFRKLR